jgi:hypothetical protein
MCDSLRGTGEAADPIRRVVHGQAEAFRPRLRLRHATISHQLIERASLSFPGPAARKVRGIRLNLTEAYRHQRISGFGDQVEVDMTTLFSFAFSAIFLGFIVAAIIGHALLIEAIVRPFFGRITLANRQTLAKSNLLPQPAR